MSVEGSCLCRECPYTDNDFHPNLGFKLPSQTLVFTLNLVSKKVLSTDNGFSLKSDFTKNCPYTDVCSMYPKGFVM